MLSTPTGYADAINARLDVPTYTVISVDAIGDENGGTVFVDITMEEAPGEGSIKVWSLILEDLEMGDASWGYFENQEMMWIPVTSAFGSSGTEVYFSGTYPQTLSVSGNYVLNPAEHPLENLYVITFVAYVGDSKEVLNASIDALQQTGLHAGSNLTSSVLFIGSNPSYGSITFSSYLPAEVTGNVSIFDLEGRLIEEQNAGSIGNVNLEESGVYFLRLTSSSGEIVRKQVTFIK